MHKIINIVFNFLNWILNHQWKFVGLLLVLAYFIGLYGYLDAIKNVPDEPLVSLEWPISSAMTWAFINLISGTSDNLFNAWIIFSSLIAKAALVFAIMITLLKELLGKSKLRMMQKVPHTLVIGLGSNNRSYLNSESKQDDQKNIIIIEQDSNNPHIKQYRDMGFGVFVGTLEEYRVNFPMLECVIISTGCDRMNIELSGMLITKIPVLMKEKEFGKPTTVHVHLENQSYKGLFQQKILSAKNDIPLEFLPYSFNDDAARTLFDQHTILGNHHDLVMSDESYSVAVMGDGALAERIIYHLCMQANLPNKNVCTIHCISKNSEAFLSHIRVLFAGIDQIGSIRIQGHSLDMNTPEFYACEVWKEKNLTNIIVCYDNENDNLECTTNLHEKVYLNQANNDEMKVKVLFAVFNLMALSKSIDDNEKEFKQFFTFADAKVICSAKHLIDEKQETIAKLIHFGYAEEYKSDQLVDITVDSEKINKKWHDRTKLSDRESNRSQALHINTKLMSMGLCKVEEDSITDKKILLDLNRNMMKQFRDAFVICDDNSITELSSKLYSSDPKDQTKLTQFFHEVMHSNDLYSKLTKAEHERWNTYHYLNGWVFTDEATNKLSKRHHCLVPLEQFSDVDRQQTIIYDLYATLYIPNYLASAGYRIVPIA